MRDLNIEVITMADVVSLDGEAGRFRATVRKRPRSIDSGKCTGCGDCWQSCPVTNVPQATAPFAPVLSLSAEDSGRLQAIVARYADEPGPLLPVLQEINDGWGYLPRPVLERVSAEFTIPLAEILRVASFYNAFKLEPVGRHLIEVCLGTACFVRGSGLLLEHLEEEIGVHAGGTDKERRFTLETVRCIGCCALAPAMRIDGITFGRIRLNAVAGILERFK
jgi:NADH:ubiquinone oxidoreductase subunit E/NAD-dependent dihydropyrimidine dehydrogenase PreA subunit